MNDPYNTSDNAKINFNFLVPSYCLEGTIIDGFYCISCRGKKIKLVVKKNKKYTIVRSGKSTIVTGFHNARDMFELFEWDNTLKRIINYSYQDNDNEIDEVLSGLLDFIDGEIFESHFCNKLHRQASDSKLLIKDGSFFKLPSSMKKYNSDILIDASLNNLYVIFLDDKLYGIFRCLSNNNKLWCSNYMDIISGSVINDYWFDKMYKKDKEIYITEFYNIFSNPWSSEITCNEMIEIYFLIRNKCYNDVISIADEYVDVKNNNNGNPKKLISSGYNGGIEYYTLKKNSK